MDYDADDIVTWEVDGHNGEVILYADEARTDVLDRVDVDGLIRAWIEAMESKGYL